MIIKDMKPSKLSRILIILVFKLFILHPSNQHKVSLAQNFSFWAQKLTHNVNFWGQKLC